jgi:hypothetical protein
MKGIWRPVDVRYTMKEYSNEDLETGKQVSGATEACRPAGLQV